MDRKSHDTLHSLVPVYASLQRIIKDAVDGFRDGKIDRFVDIRKEAEEAQAQLIMVEGLLAHTKHKRRAYEKGEI